MQWCEITPATVLNRGLTNESNSAKAYQAQLIRLFFDIPDKMVTNDPAAARPFAEHYGRVIYKSCSGERSIVAELDPNEIDAAPTRCSPVPCCFRNAMYGFTWSPPTAFETNPRPAFSAHQDATGQPIAEAVAEYLMAELPNAGGPGLLPEFRGSGSSRVSLIARLD